MKNKHQYYRDKLITINRFELYDLLKKVVKDRMAKEEEGHEAGKRYTSSFYNYRYFWKMFTKFFLEYTAKSVKLTNDGLASSFRDFIIVNQNYQNSYARTMVSILIACMNKAGIDHRISKGKLFRGYSVKKWESEELFLTRSEVDNIMKLSDEYYGPKYECEENYEGRRHVLDHFVLSLLTGARRSEVVTIQKIPLNRIKYTSEKTKQEMTVANHPRLKRILKRGKYKEHPNSFMFTKSLKNIFRRCGIDSQVTVYERRGKTKVRKEVEKWIAISFHTARKTYGKMLLDNGVDIYTVSKLLGHSSVVVTERAYAAVDKDRQVELSQVALKNI